MRHEFEACTPKMMKARALNRCNCCRGGISRGEEYAMVLLLDRCFHWIRNKQVNMHERLKFCIKCLPALLLIEEAANVSSNGRFRNEARNLITHYGFRMKSRYDIARGDDLLKNYVNNCHMTINKPSLTLIRKDYAVGAFI